MKRKPIILLMIILLTLSVSLWAGNFHFGVVSAVKDKVEEAKEKRDRDRADKVPEVAISSPITTASISGIFNITVEANDDQGITKVEFYINGALKSTDSVLPYSYSWDTTQYSNGTYTVMAKAYDTADQTISSQLTVTVENDRVPTISIVAPADGVTISGAVVIRVEASDDKGVSKVEFSIDDVLKSADTSVPYSYSWDTTQYTKGTHSIKAVAYDTSNQSASVQHIVTIESASGDKAPIITITEPADGATVFSTVVITVDVTAVKEVNKVEYYIDDVLKSADYYAPYSYSWNTTYDSSGTHIVTVKVYDTDNQTGTDQHTVTVNQGEPPTVTMTAPADSATVSGTVDITATATDDKGVDSVRFYVDDGFIGSDYNAPYSCSWNTIYVSTGTHIVKVKVYDITNQTGTDQRTVTVYNGEPPAITITAPADSATVSGTVDITATATDDNGISKVEFYVDTKLMGSDYSEPYSYFWDTTQYINGSKIIKAIVYDTTNQKVTAQHTVTVSNDTNGWLTSILDDSIMYYCSGSSIDIDTSNNPHVAYYNSNTDKLNYAKWTGSAWNIETIDIISYMYYAPSLSLDSNNQPRMAYIDYDSSDLKYAKWTGSSWSIAIIDASNVGYRCSLALDSNNDPYIVYQDSMNYDLIYAKWTGSAWNVETVDSSGNVGSCLSLDLDINNNPHIVYYDSTNENLKYAKWTGSTWEIEIVDTISYMYNSPSLKLDTNNNPCIAYIDCDSFDVKYAKRTGSSWSIEIIADAGWTSTTCSLALDSYNNPHISYYDESKSDLKYAQYSGSEWIIQTADAVGNAGNYSSLVLDGNDDPHITYFDSTNYKIKYATK